MDAILIIFFFPPQSQSHQLVRPVDAAQQAASVCTASLATSAASTVVTSVCAAPTANTAGEISWLQNGPSGCE